MLPNPKQRDALINMDDWARSWAREESDRAVGAAIVLLLLPVMAQLVCEGLAINTLRRHKGNLYLLGARVLDDMTQFPEDAPATVGAALDSLISSCEYECPELRDADEAEQRAFDATCRRVYKFRGAQRSGSQATVL